MWQTIGFATKQFGEIQKTIEIAFSMLHVLKMHEEERTEVWILHTELGASCKRIVLEESMLTKLVDVIHRAAWAAFHELLEKTFGFMLEKECSALVFGSLLSLESVEHITIRLGFSTLTNSCRPRQ